MQHLITEHFHIAVPCLMMMGAAWIWYDYRQLLQKLKTCAQPPAGSLKPTPEMSGALSWSIRTIGKLLVLIFTGMIAMLVHARVLDRNQAAALAWTLVIALVAGLMRYMIYGVPTHVWQWLLREARQCP